MKKLYATALGLAVSLGMNAQSFSDDFESYNVGDYVGQQSSNWTTWSGNTGSAEDAQVVDTEASSGTKSIYFASSSQGPQDVVLPFGSAYETGLFKYEMMMFVSTGTDAYFNFQAEQTIGQTWAMDCYIEGNGSMSMSNQGGSLISGTVPTGQWFRLSYEINLNLNKWEVFVDSTSIGSFSNTVNKVASIDIFPLVISGSGSSSSEFWIDDVFFEYQTITLPAVNGAVTNIIDLRGLATADVSPTVVVKNLGQNNITSFDLEVAYNGSSISESVTGVDIASLEEYEVKLSGGLTLIAGANDMVATISNVNDSPSDDDASDDSFTVSVDPVVPALHKRVLVEEATGTWCQWCPRGAVWMANMQEWYPSHFVGVAVHNGDPMTNATYDDGLGTLISGYPSSVVDRGADIDPSGMEPDFLERVQEEPFGKICLDVDYTEGASSFDINMKIEVLKEINQAFKIAFIVTEDSVTGTTSGYNQANAYAGGGSGELSGAGLDWHLEPSSVPASKMVYNHVGRAIAPSFTGLANSFPNGGAVGDTFWFTTTVNIDSEWDLDFLHVAGVLFDGAGNADNAIAYHFDEIFENDCATMPLGASSVANQLMGGMEVYPNPATNELNIQLTRAQQANGSIQVRDMLGKVVYSSTLKPFTGIHNHAIDISNLTEGVYLVTYFDGKTTQTTRFIKK